MKKNLHTSHPLWTTAVLALLLMCFVPLAAYPNERSAVTAEPTVRQGTPNRLIDSGSPYLLQHAYNPVDWYPWGREALDRAKRENKPIFLSVGYSTCYWCHVANTTLYSNPEIAAMMNRWFINIKVDREQRPDVDRIYIQATLLMTETAGWPNNLFLTPDLQPFFAGTYFPPSDDDFGRPGFTTILKQLHSAWEDQRPAVIASAQQIHARLREAVQRRAANPDQPVDIAHWRQMADAEMRAEFDAKNGGMSTASGSKFPQGPVLDLLLAEARRGKNAQRAMLIKTLDAMAFGGIHDQVGGGFHRYTTEPTWSAPHYEKMLYDNAQLLRIYAQAFEITRSATYKVVAERTADWLLSDLGAPEGGFYTALDASVAGEEGISYLWERAAIDALLGAQESKRYFNAFELKPVTQRNHVTLEEYGVLRIRLPINETLRRTRLPDASRLFSAYAASQTKLLAARNLRKQPARDEKILVALNGLAIEAFAQSSRILGKAAYLNVARRAADHVWSLAYDPASGRLYHESLDGRAQIDGFLEDYALLGRALMALHNVTREPIWRQRAALLADVIVRDFLRPDGALTAVRDQSDLLVSADDTSDQSYPSGTSAALDLLLQLAAGNRQSQYARAAQNLIKAMSATLYQSPLQWPSFLATLALTPVGKVATPGPSVASAKAAPATKGVARGLLPGSADKVTIVARVNRGKNRDEVVADLTIKPGWHINANPASFEFLIPTSISFDGVTPQSVRYPVATPFSVSFTPTVIAVYQGKVSVVAKFVKGVLPKKTLRATLSTQACDETVCLPPAKIPFSVPTS